MELPSAVTGPVDAAIEFIYSFGPLVEHTVVLGKSFQSNKMKENLMCRRHWLATRSAFGSWNRQPTNSCHFADLIHSSRYFEGPGI
jgi:hypothetical protein